MNQQIRRALHELSDSIDRNLPHVEAKLRKAGVTPDPALVYTAAKYFEALNKLATE
jgi:hypothetical protein